MTLHNFEYTSAEEAFLAQFAYALDPDNTDLRFRGVAAWTDDIRISIAQPDPTKLNMGLVDFTPTRWSRFAQHYIDRGHFQDFLNRLPNLRPNQTAGYNTPVRAEHSMGNCLIGFTARRRESKRLEVQLYSRTTIWAPTGILDLYLGSLVCEWWKVQTGYQPTLTWILTQRQFTTWKSLAYLVNVLHMHKPSSGDLHDSWWGKVLTSGEPTQNRYLQGMRKTYYEARNIHLFMERTYRLPARQTNRMLSAERRFLAGQQRDLRPPIESLLDPDGMGQLVTTLGEEDDDDEDMD